jgi:hypothetical protein
MITSSLLEKKTIQNQLNFQSLSPQAILLVFSVLLFLTQLILWSASFTVKVKAKDQLDQRLQEFINKSDLKVFGLVLLQELS